MSLWRCCSEENLFSSLQKMCLFCEYILIRSDYKKVFSLLHQKYPSIFNWSCFFFLFRICYIIFHFQQFTVTVPGTYVHVFHFIIQLQIWVCLLIHFLLNLVDTLPIAPAQNNMLSSVLSSPGLQERAEIHQVFQTEFQMRLLWGSRGSEGSQSERYEKFDKVLTALSHKLEPPVRHSEL